MAVPAAVSEALSAMGADGAAVAVLFLVAVFGVRAVKFIQRAAFGDGSPYSRTGDTGETFVYRNKLGNSAAHHWSRNYRG